MENITTNSIIKNHKELVDTVSTIDNIEIIIDSQATEDSAIWLIDEDNLAVRISSIGEHIDLSEVHSDGHITGWYRCKTNNLPDDAENKNPKQINTLGEPLSIIEPAPRYTNTIFFKIPVLNYKRLHLSDHSYRVQFTIDDSELKLSFLIRLYAAFPTRPGTTYETLFMNPKIPTLDRTHSPTDISSAKATSSHALISNDSYMPLTKTIDAFKGPLENTQTSRHDRDFTKKTIPTAPNLTSLENAGKKFQELSTKLVASASALKQEFDSLDKEYSDILKVINNTKSTGV